MAMLPQMFQQSVTRVTRRADHMWLMRWSRRVLSVSLLAYALAAPAAFAQESGDPDAHTPTWYLQAGVYWHYSDKEEYDGPPVFAGIEYERSVNSVIGISVFNNSYGQFSQYAYYGKSWYPSDTVPGFRFKVTAGVVHGYTGEHKKIMPVRWGDGWGIGVVPGIGYQRDALGVDLALLSASGVLLLVGYEF